jgi:hypothetical protein
MDDDAFARFESEYCPPLDPALLSAILSDFDLRSEHDARKAQETLDALKESALLEEHLGFDASGTGAREGAEQDAPRSGSVADDATPSLSRDTDTTSLSNGMSSLDLDHAAYISANSHVAEEVETLDEDIKIQLLEQILEKRVSRYTVQHTLRKCNGKWHAAMEELLSHVYFQEFEDGEDGAKVAAKGIDAFAVDQVLPRVKKGRNKRKSLRSVEASSPVSPVTPTSPTSNAWQSSSKDTEFITSRTNLSPKTVSSVYHKHGASLARTIGVILKSNLDQGKAAVAEEPVMAVNAHDLGTEFPTIAPEYVAALISLTYPSTAAAHEMAKALTTRPVHPGGIQIIPNYSRPVLDEDEDEDWHKVRAPPRMGSTEVSSEDARAAREVASGYAAARNAALAQAYAAHRKAKSNPLMGGAAAYYGQVSRDLYTLSTAASAEAAYRLAESQSSKTELDLHGVDVLNAVNIAERKTEEWWGSLGENRANGRLGAQDRHTGFRIIVGQGRHSEGGISKLRPAVSKMLRSNGWRFESVGPAIHVLGRARK